MAIGGERTRKFLREVGSIILGVLIALGIGEVADRVRHRHEARLSLDRVLAEIALNGMFLEERMMSGRCITRRLDELREELRRARRTGRLRDLGEIGRPTSRPLSGTAWEALVGRADTLYLPADRVALAVRYHNGRANFLERQGEELLDWARLRVLQGRPGPVSDDLMATMETTVEEAEVHALLLNVIARQMWLRQADLRVASDYGYFATSPAETRAAVRASPTCRPLVVRG